MKKSLLGISVLVVSISLMAMFVGGIVAYV